MEGMQKQIVIFFAMQGDFANEGHISSYNSFELDKAKH